MKLSPRALTPSTVACFCTFLVAACLAASGVSSAAPCITLSKKSGPPTTQILVSGRGFEPNVGVDIYFDTKDEALVVTNGKGEFKNAKAHAPRSAHPGQHWITALERNNDKGAQMPFLVQTDWNEFHFAPDREGMNPYENVLDVHTVRELGTKWIYRTTDTVWGSPAVVDGIAYVATLSMFCALNANTGALIWKVAPPLYDLWDTDPAVADGIVYIGTHFGSGLFAFNANTGAALWNYSSVYSWVLSSPAVVNGLVYFGDRAGYLYALKARTGNLVWKSSIGNQPIISDPAVGNGVLYIGSDDDNLYAVDASTGAVLWKYTTGWSVRTTPTIANGMVYFGSYDHNLYALNANNGTLLWKYPLGGEWVWSSPAVADGVVYVGSYDDNVYALDAFTGAKLWSYATQGYVGGSPTVANGVVYVGSLDGNVYALDASTGAFLWSYTTGNYVWSSPTVVNGVVYVGSDDGNAYAFNLHEGDQAKHEGTSQPELNALRPDHSLKITSVATPSRR